MDVEGTPATATALGTGDDLPGRIADLLRECADLLEQQGANPFRVSAYRRAAGTLISADLDIPRLLAEKGVEGLVDLPHIGKGLAASIAEMVTTGRWSRLERLRGSVDPEKLFRSVPGIGPALSRVIHDSLHVDTLEGLEAAAHDGRLESVRGVGPRRAASIRASLARMLGRIPRRREEGTPLPGVDTLLDVDEEYRRRSDEGDLHLVTPRRFNPDGGARIPVLHTQRGAWHFTALFSNTPRAHELGRTRDWVVIYFYDGEHREGQQTVVTERGGFLAGRRVVRGREGECGRYYGTGDGTRPG